MRNRTILKALDKFKFDHNFNQYVQEYTLIELMVKYIEELETRAERAEDSYSRLRYPDNTGQ